jgi:hypothetical protein
MKNIDRKCEFRNPSSSESPVLIENQTDFQKNYGDLNTSFLILYLFINLLSWRLLIPDALADSPIFPLLRAKTSLR